VNVSDDRLIDSIRAAGMVPPPPARDEAFAHAMGDVVSLRAHRRFRRGIIALFAAAMLGAPAGVFAARTFTNAPRATSRITTEVPDHRSSVARETADEAKPSSGPSETREHISDDYNAGGSDGSSSDDGSSIEATQPTSEDSTKDSSADASGGTASVGGDGGDVVATPTPTSSELPDGGSTTDGGTSDVSSGGAAPVDGASAAP
jgi:hypothetical protein